MYLVFVKVQNRLQEIYSNQKQLFSFKMAGGYQINTPPCDASYINFLFHGLHAFRLIPNLMVSIHVHVHVFHVMEG